MNEIRSGRFCNGTGLSLKLRKWDRPTSKRKLADEWTTLSVYEYSVEQQPVPAKFHRACALQVLFRAILVTWHLTWCEEDFWLADSYRAAAKRGGHKLLHVVYIVAPKKFSFTKTRILWPLSWIQVTTTTIQDLGGVATILQNITMRQGETFNCRRCWMFCSATSTMVVGSTAASAVSRSFSCFFSTITMCINI